MAVTGDEEVYRVRLQLRIILRVIAQENIIVREFAEAGQELCVYLPGDLLGGNSYEQDVLNLHSTVIQQRNIRILEDRFILSG